MAAKKRFFITATDTDAGKTFVAAGILAAAKRAGLATMGLKPVAAGAELVDGVLRNDDALALMAQTSVKLTYEQINPVLLKEAIAPHIAAENAGVSMSVARLEGVIKGALLTPHDFALVEGAGGWRVPLNSREMLSDLAKSLNFPVILVVNMKLGCINHATLSAEAIQRDGLNLVGWVANMGDSMPYYEENVAAINSIITAPLLAKLTQYQNVEDSFLEFDNILSQL
ncbi:dethiobiotin synthase [Marinomonas sp. SBI22]|uniref:dethiobiotin synthase n=1 Tax=unclassified Marinomonas TaxID=196814 RepID=UPI0007AFB6CE|nr:MULTISPECIES: dethiobiotin synthase [unclassified Marinomonas]KZM40000.1 dethiobiotin synthase [Marinomonas sp. SBI22]KZM41294.1 dethiobiotin synthase [Marinomonas sp. SBI8L]